MEQNNQQKTEPPSKRKIERARRQGDVAVSRELAGVCGVVATCLAVSFIGGSTVAELSQLAQRCWLGGEVREWAAALWQVLMFIGVVGGAAALASAFALIAQVGLRFRLRLHFSRLDPIKGIYRLFSRQRLLDLLLMLVKLVALVVVGWWYAAPLAGQLLGKWTGELESAAGVGVQILVRLLLCLVVVALISGVLDRLIQRRRFLKRMRMTRQEVIRERKEEEGNPTVKSERQRRHRQLLSGVGFAGLRRASVVVVNPTRIAVALGYRPEEDEAPWVLAAGRGAMARKMRDHAVRLGIPVVQHVPLARALSRLELGTEIPESLYEAAAEVIRSLQGRKVTCCSTGAVPANPEATTRPPPPG